MKKQVFKAEFTKKVTLEEFAYGLQVMLEKSDHIGTAGILIPKTAEKLKEDQKETEKFYQKARRHKFMKCSSDGKISLERNIDTILKSISNSRFCVVMQKPSWKNNNKLISVYWTNGCYIAAYQEKSSNQVTIFLDHSPENLYQVLEEYLLKKDGKVGWKKKKLNEFLKKEQLPTSEISPIVRLQCTFLDNWKNKIHTQENILLNEEKLEQYATDGNGVWQEKANAAEFKKRILDIWKRLEHDCEVNLEEKTEEKKSKLKGNNTVTQSKWNYDSLLEMEGFPKSYLGYIKWIIISLFSSGKQLAKTSLLSMMKKILPTILGSVLFGVCVTFWNMYATCYLNDTYFFERRSMWGDLTPYLLAGSLRTPSNLKGFQLDWGNITTEYIVLPLSVFGFLLLRGILARIHKKGIMAIPKDIIGIIPLVIQCKKICKKPIFYFIQKGLFYACIFGFALFNPFAVALIVPIVLLSFAQGEESAMALTIMSWRTAGSVKKVEQGKIKPLVYEEVLLDVFGLAMGFFIYTIFNAIMWNFFDYDFKLRLVLSILLLLSTFVQVKKKPKNPSKTNQVDQNEKKKEEKKKLTKQEKIQKIQAIVFVSICFIVAVTVLSLVLKSNIAFADDGGWSESGRTLEGLMANAGFGLIMGISALVGLATFGVGLGVAAGIAAVTAGAATIFASTTEYGHRTAEQLVYGRYSDSDPTILGTALQIGIEMIPVWGNIYGLGAGARDISYDVQNWEGTTEDYINLGIDLFGFTMNGIGLKNDLDKLASFDGDMSKFTDFSNSSKKELVDEPFDDAGNLKANSRYQTGEYGYYYETDDMGRISSFEADDLQMTTRSERLKHNPNSLGKEAGDDAGHLIADRFGGSSDLDNIVSQASGINRSDYKIIENKWAKALENGQSVSVKGELIYEGTSLRPSGFQLEWTIDGEYFSDFLPNFK